MKRLNEEWTAEVVGRLHRINVTQKELADECGYTAQYLCQVLNCKKKFESDYSKKFTMRRIFNALSLLERRYLD